MNKAVAAGIVTYNPHLPTLRSLIHSLQNQVRKIYIFDNHSENCDRIDQLVESSQKCDLIRSNTNLGVAAALNRIIDRAASEEFEHLVTFDQDSIPPPEMIQELQKNMRRGVALAAPLICDRRKMKDPARLPDGSVTTYRDAARKGAITSGSLIDLNAVAAIGGFDETFFIDYVDYDLNARLMNSGYRLLLVTSASMSHQVGEASPTPFFVVRRGVDRKWNIERVYTFGHSATRCYYKARNRILYSRKHWRATFWKHEGVAQLPVQILITLLFEKDKKAKGMAFINGITDGLRSKINTGNAHYLDPKILEVKN